MTESGLVLGGYIEVEALEGVLLFLAGGGLEEEPDEPGADVEGPVAVILGMLWLWGSREFLERNFWRMLQTLLV